MAKSTRPHNGKKPLICIAICTRNRPQLLRRAIRSLAKLKPCKANDVCLLIVENEATAKQKNTLESLQLPFPLNYCHEPNIGLVHARNRALDEAQALGADWLASFDDDQEADENWLRSYEMAALARPDIHFFAGPRQFRYDQGYSRFLRKVYSHDLLPKQHIVHRAGTGNAFYHKTVFYDGMNHLRFNQDYNFSGGEDTEFFNQIEAQKIKMHWLVEAIIFEDKTGDRNSLKRAVRDQKHRQFTGCRIRYASVAKSKAFLTDILLINHYIAYGTGYLIAGICLLPLTPSRAFRIIGDACLKFGRLSGVASFYLGHTPTAYK